MVGEWKDGAKKEKYLMDRNNSVMIAVRRGMGGGGRGHKGDKW